MLNKMKHWSRTTDMGRIFWKRFTIFDQDLSPDYLAYRQSELLRKHISKLASALIFACALNHTKIEYDKVRNKKCMIENTDEADNCPYCTRKKPVGGSKRRRHRKRKPRCTRKKIVFKHVSSKRHRSK